MSTDARPTQNGTDSKDEFARELGYESLADCPRQVRLNIEHSWPNVRVGSFSDLVDELAEDL